MARMRREQGRYGMATLWGHKADKRSPAFRKENLRYLCSIAILLLSSLLPFSSLSSPLPYLYANDVEAELFKAASQVAR